MPRTDPRAALRHLLLALVILAPGTPQLLAQEYGAGLLRARGAAAAGSAAGANRPPGRETRFQQAPPAPSGADPVYPLNHTFDAEVRSVGTPPANVGFEQAGSAAGAPPANHDFAGGGLAPWAASGTASVVADPENAANPIARIDAGTLTSAAVAADAQFVSVRVRGLSAQTDQYKLAVLSGSGFGTATQVAFTTAADAWTVVRVNVVAWRGQEIELRPERFTGAVGFDDAGPPRVDLPGWEVEAGKDAAVLTGGPDGAHARTSGILTTTAFALAADAQQVSLRYLPASSGTGVTVDLLRGAGFGTVVALAPGGLRGAPGQWQTAEVGVGPYAGETVKLRISPEAGAVGVDAVGPQTEAVPGWTPTTTGPVAVGEDANGTYLARGRAPAAISLRSVPIASGIVDRANTNDFRYYRIAFDIGYATGDLVRVYWQNTAGQEWAVFQEAANTPTGYRDRLFWVADFMGATGTLRVNLAGAGKLYSVADNVARAQLGEPFALKVGLRVDTTTGSFGTAGTDLAIAGGPLPVSLTRYYAAHSDRFGTLGSRWSHSYDTRLAIGPDGDAGVVFGSGREEYFAWNATAGTLSGARRGGSRTPTPRTTPAA